MAALIKNISNNKYFTDGSVKYYIVLLIMILMPVYHWYLPPFMILLAILMILEFVTGKTDIKNINVNHRILFTLFILFFLWQLLGILYSDNPKEGWRNIELHLSLLIFPLVLISPGEMIRKKTGRLLQVFALSTFLFILFCFVFALYRSLSIKNGILIFNPYLPEYSWLNYFYGTDFAVFQHTSYLSMFVLLSVYISLESFSDNSLPKVRRIMWLLSGLILFISIYFLSSRAGILSALITLPCYLFIKSKTGISNRYIVLGIVIILMILIPVALTNPRVNNYVKWRSERGVEDTYKPNDRIIIWNSAKEIMKKNLFFGVGTGDIQDELNMEYLRTGNKKLADVNTNSHNQYFEIILENGLIGLLIFLISLGMMIYQSLKQKNIVYSMFILIVFTSFLFETMLNRLAGVTFFSLFSFLLIFLKKQNQITDHSAVEE